MRESNFFNGYVCKCSSWIYLCTSILERSVRLGVRTPDFHSGNTGSIPVQTTKPLTFNKLKAFFMASMEPVVLGIGELAHKISSDWSIVDLNNFEVIRSPFKSHSCSFQYLHDAIKF